MKVLVYEELRPVKGIPYSKNQIYRKVKEGTFPAPIKLGAHRNAWLEDELDEHLENLRAQRDAERGAA